MRWPLGLAIALGVRAAVAAQAPIVNGLPTADHPAVGALLSPSNPDRAALVCSGTLIGCRTFLTAGHCVEGAAAGTFVVFFQHVGFVGVSGITMHPSYDYPVGDVAVLTLATPVTGVRPASIDTGGGQPPGTSGTIVGFGRSGGTSQDYGLKRQGRVSIAPCTDGVSDTTSICWTFAAPVGAPGEDSNTCNGDSGGPLFTDDGTGARIAGVTSGGSSDACLVVDESYDARIATYAAFIQSASGGDQDAVCSNLAVIGSAQASVTTFAGVLGTATPQGAHVLDVPAGAELLRVTMNAIDDGSDFDLYVRAGSPPTTATYDCAARGAGQFAACEFTAPAAGPWYVLLDRYTGSGGYQVTATSFASLCADPGNDGAPCDDGDACTTGEQCTAGRCTGSVPVSCDDGVACTVDTCDPSSGCRHTVQHAMCGTCATCDKTGGCISGPRPDCLSTIYPGAAMLKMRDAANDASDRLVWKWTKGATTRPADLGAPGSTTSYHFCLYDEQGAASSLVAHADIPAGGLCGGRPCWQGSGGSFKYRNSARTPDGISRLAVKAGVAGRAKVTLKGKGGLLSPLPALPLGLPMRAQLQADGGACFEAVFGHAGTVRNDAATFIGRDD